MLNSSLFTTDPIVNAASIPKGVSRTAAPQNLYQLNRKVAGGQFKCTLPARNFQTVQDRPVTSRMSLDQFMIPQLPNSLQDARFIQNQYEQLYQGKISSQSFSHTPRIIASSGGGGTSVIEKPATLTFSSIQNMTQAGRDKGGGGRPPPVGTDGDWGDDGGGDSRELTQQQKYLIKGIFAHQCLFHAFPDWFVQELRNDPHKELSMIQKVRSYMMDLEPHFKPTFDINTKTIHYCCSKEYFNGLIDKTTPKSRFRVIKWVKKLFSSQKNYGKLYHNNTSKRTDLLNTDVHYVKYSMIIDNEETKLNEKSSFYAQIIKEGHKPNDGSTVNVFTNSCEHVFVPNAVIFQRIKDMIDEDNLMQHEYNKTRLELDMHDF